MKKNTKGFTLIELSLYMSLLSILLLVLATIFTQILDVRLESESGSSVSSDERFIISRFAYDIGRADNVAIPTVLGDNTTTLQLTINSVNYTYNLNSTNLVLTDAIGMEKLNSFGTRVSNLTFKRLGNLNGKHTIQIHFTLTSTVSRTSGPEVKNSQTTIGLR